MRVTVRTGLLAVAMCGAVLITPATVRAQAGAAAGAPAIMDALVRDVSGVEEKLLALAAAIPESQYGWRPAEGVRSVGEVLVHVAADNWFLPTAVGVAAPAETGIRAGDYATVQAYEGRQMSRDEAMAAVRASFAFLRAAMEKTEDASLGRTLNLFGTEMTGTDLWVLTTTHLHEHLGQMIAYARSNNVTPPWSR